MTQNLTTEELQIEHQRLTGEYVPVENLKEEMAKYQAWAKAYNQRRKITISMVERHLQQIKVLAAEAWIPYQTYLNSIIHKFLTGQLVEKKHLASIN